MKFAPAERVSLFSQEVLKLLNCTNYLDLAIDPNIQIQFSLAKKMPEQAM